MSDVNYDADRFLRSIVKSKPAPVTPAAFTKKPEPRPQVVEEIKPVDSDAEFRRRYDAELDAIVEMERHPDVFDESAAGMENVERVLSWIVQRGEYPSRANVSEAIRALKKELVLVARSTTGSTPSKQEPVARLVVPQAVVATTPTPPDPEAGLPPLPPYVIRILGDNKLRTKKDIRAIRSDVFSHLYKGPHAQAFKARIEAIGRRNRT